MKKQPNIELTLLKNSYNFIEESLVSYWRVSEDEKVWPFALLHLTHGIELLLKEVLRREHEILVYENIDKPNNTVSLEKALHRLITIMNVDIDNKERANISRAIKIRNQIIHSEFKLNTFEAKSIYLQLFEFVHYFHRKHLNKEIHDEIDQSFWEIEADLINEFKNDMVHYNGTQVFRTIPKQILFAQNFGKFNDGIETKDRIKYGEEIGEFKSATYDYCPDCGVKKGQYHIDYCDTEQCPFCLWQLLSCNCDITALANQEEE